MLVDRRRFLNLALANTVATSIYPLDAEQSNTQSPTKSATTFAFQQVDVFSSKPLLGNPLAVVVGADALSNEQMSALANWTNLSETTFLLEPRSKAALCRPPHLGQLSRLAVFGRQTQRKRDRAGMRTWTHPHPPRD
jgi:hypothetical protein